MDCENMCIISGRSNIDLSKRICKLLDLELLNLNLDNFSNGEIKIELNESIRERNIYIIQTGFSDSLYSVNDYLMELFGIIDACKRSSSGSISIIIPLFPYARSDKKDRPQVPIMASVIARMFESFHVKSILTLDIHSGQIQGFCNFRFDNLFATEPIVSTIKNELFTNLTQDEILERFILVSPDNGSIKRIQDYARLLSVPYITIHKQRDYHSQNSITIVNMMIISNFSIQGKIAIIIDDIIDTAGTIVKASELLCAEGIKKVIIFATHGILSGSAFEKINQCDPISRLYVTNTVPQDTNKSKKLNIIDISPLLAEAIKRLENKETLIKFE